MEGGPAAENRATEEPGRQVTHLVEVGTTARSFAQNFVCVA
jgi:hypothetical protein